MQAELLLDAQATLGEGPAWDDKTQTLYWVDILAKRIHVYRDGRDDFLQLDEYVGCAAPRRAGGLVAALHASFATVEPGAPKPMFLARVDEPSTNRFNDGKCDPAGRFLAGTMDMDEKSASGNLYSLVSNSPPRLLLDGIRISNGLAWSPDYETFYYIDTPTRQVRAYDYDLDTGNLSHPRVAVEVPASMGWPDGMTSDMEGKLWVALWGGARVARWNPLNGQVEAEVSVPALQTSSCVFGGPRRDILYVTSARVGMDESTLEKYPLSGGLFQIQTRTEGMKTFEFV
ncbi:MAG: SMP-30/gluconolactonase/LRE family protein [Chloroflexota bacterium]